MRLSRLTALLLVAVGTAAVVAACAGTGSNAVATNGGGGVGNGTGGAAGLDSGTGGSTGIDSGAEAPQSPLVVTPSTATVTYASSSSPPTVTFKATEAGAPVTANWTIDRAEIGNVSSQGVFTAAGVAGTANVTASSGGLSGTATVTVVVKQIQNGAPQPQPKPGSGGYDGVGGYGLGGKVTSAIQTTLDKTPTADPNLAWLYPYDKTVFPLGMLAPLLQWTTTGAEANADGIRIHLSAPGYDYKGYFAPPSALPSGQAFDVHPIPQEVWQAAAQSAAGHDLTVELVVAKNGTAYGPITETWPIANGLLQGVVYYQAYGTDLVHNQTVTAYGGGTLNFGAATLAIQPGATSPTLVAGTDGDMSACRACHSVSADGNRMIVQHGDNYSVSSSYALKSNNQETAYPSSTTGELGWMGMYPDGSVGVNNGVHDPIKAPSHADSVDSELRDLTTGNVLPSTGLSTFVTQAGVPAFSPDGKHMAFNFYAGPGNAQTGPGNGSELAILDFDKASSTFSNGRLLYQGNIGAIASNGQSALNTPSWPTFMPTNNAVVFELQKAGPLFMTWHQAQAELWWVDVATGKAHELDAADGKDSSGKSYLPSGPNNHTAAADAELDFLPTVAPIASGGYAWMVFETRRMYGSVATLDAYCSDPRNCDMTTGVTTKKLWVAAVDLNPTAGTDPSHPAFYLPAQELLAGNSRGYWVQSPCKKDGATCTAGVQCCGGYCEQDPKTGAFTCGQTKQGCSPQYDKCTTTADCCAGQNLQCINSVCQVVVH